MARNPHGNPRNRHRPGGGTLVSGFQISVTPRPLIVGATATVTVTAPAGWTIATIAAMGATLSGSGLASPAVRTYAAPSGAVTITVTGTDAQGQAVSRFVTVTAQAASVLTIADFSRDRVLFDSGSALGQDIAAIPLSGTATPGAVVQARVVTGAGVAVTGWTNVATANGSGAWSGPVSCARNAAWLRPEVRLAVSTGVTATTVNRFGVGHVLAIHGQSEANGILTANPTTGETLLADDMVQIIGTGVQVRHVTAAAPISSPVVALANTLIAARPGEKFAVIFHTRAGKGFEELLNDSDTSWPWTDETAVHVFATADGQSVGVATFSWFAAEKDLNTAYGDTLFKLLLAKSPDTGAAVTFPADIAGGWGGKITHYDHWFGEMYDWTRTRILPYGPHRFDPSEDMTNATVSIDGNDGSALLSIQGNRTGYRTAMASAYGSPAILPLGIEPMSYLNGVSGGSAGWDDVAHPSTASVDGAPRHARYTALALLQGAGLVSIATPVFDQCVWQADGSYVEVWSSAGAITTTRRVRGVAALGSTYAHWTDVLGFEVNNVPVDRAEIQSNGRVRIYPISGSFVSTDVLTFGRGGGTGMLQVPEDYTNACWLNYPIVAGSPVSTIEGIDVRPMPSAAVLTNTIPASAWAITAGDASATITTAPAAPTTPTVTAGDASATVTN